MSFTIAIGDGQDAYVFSTAPEFTPQVEVLRNSKSERIGERHIWHICGFLAGTDAANINSKWNALRERLQNEKVNCYFKKDGTVLQSLITSDVHRGPQFSGIRIISSGNSAWDTNLQFDFDIVAEIYDSETDIIDNEYKITYRQLENGQFEQSKSGHIKVREGASAQEAAALQALAVPSNYRLIFASIVKNDDDTEADYNYTIRSLFSTLPENIAIAERVIDESIEDGIKTTTYRATFTGSGAIQAAERFKPDGAVIRQSKSIGEDSNSVSITYTIRDSTDGTQRICYANTISVKSEKSSCVEFSVDGQRPLIFAGAQGKTVIYETGESIYKGQIPPQHPVIDDSRLILVSQFTTVKIKERGTDFEPVTYIRSWRYTYWSSEAVSIEDIPSIESRLSGREGR